MSATRHKFSLLPAQLRNLFDHWVPEMLSVIGTLRFLQFLRLLGAKARVNGWRKVTSIFLRGESARFVLASLRLLPDAQGLLPPPDRKTAELRLAAKFAAYVRNSEAVGYYVEPGRYAFVRRKRRFADLLLVHVSDSGWITSLTPFFDPSAPELGARERKILDEVLSAVMRAGNAVRSLPETRRAPELLKELNAWLQTEVPRYRYFGRKRRKWLMERILHAAILFTEVMPQDAETRYRVRFPDFRKFRNPCLGMLGAVARFTADFREVDLWCQFNHVAADGAPMQEFLTRLKAEWGAAGEVHFPALPPSGVSRPEVRYVGDGAFRAQLFADFAPLLAIRKKLNENLTENMDGHATVPGLFLWGLTRHEAFARRKFLLPVDLGNRNGDRELGFVTIRPRQFAQPRRGNAVADFCDCQKELNRRVNLVRSGHGAAREFLELCALMHPFFYHAANLLMPMALQEILGTAALSILRKAEIFIGPVTEFQTGGFVTIGDVNIPTDDGKSAGCICITGKRSQVAAALAAIRPLLRELPEELAFDAEIHEIEN